jgi:hypothetical protein
MRLRVHNVLLLGIVLLSTGCQPSRVCSRLPAITSEAPRDSICGCFDLERISGGIAGGWHDARSQGLFRALVIRPGSQIEFYEGDSLRLTTQFEINTQYQRLNLSLQSEYYPGLSLYMIGRDTVIAWQRNVADGVDDMYVRNRRCQQR